MSYIGRIETKEDALILAHACESGEISLVTCRVTDPTLIQSGTIFIYNQTANIKRWTDGLSWSPV